MWVVWALIIFGVVWDAADSAMLRYAKDNICISVVERQPSQNKVELYGRCQEGSDGQTWLWEGKKLKTKLTGQCIWVDADSGYAHPSVCTLPSHYNEKWKQSNKERLEFTRFGEHGLKNSKGKCLKFNSGGLRFVANCTEDKEDPYYE
jgi:hypothetical protein